MVQFAPADFMSNLKQVLVYVADTALINFHNAS